MGQGDRVEQLRRALLEFWAMAMIAVAIGFLGPFGTFTKAGFAHRVIEWGSLLIGAYILVRPCLWLLRQIAIRTALPVGALELWGVVGISAPLAMIWRRVGQDAYRALDSFTELVPFALLCALVVLGVARWAQAVGARYGGGRFERGQAAPVLTPLATPEAAGDAAPVRPRLLDSLSAQFREPIVALQSEDHYVRVHGADGSELVLMRLRDAIAALDGVAGEQVHRSWWVAQSAVAELERDGRVWSLRLVTGARAPIARDSLHRLRQSGFLAGLGAEAGAADR